MRIFSARNFQDVYFLEEAKTLTFQNYSNQLFETLRKQSAQTESTAFFEDLLQIFHLVWL